MTNQVNKHRLTHLPTLRIQPDRKISFRFGLKRYRGFEGDSVATALFAGGRRIFSRSIKHRRPRGLFSLDGEGNHTLIAVDGIPGVMTGTVRTRKGIKIKAQNIRPGAFLDRLDWLMPAGFPLTRFHRPLFLWPFFSRRIRKKAGIGRIHPQFRIRTGCPRQHLHPHICVIGGGVAGMTAALTAANHHLNVVLLESRSWLGGEADHRETVLYNDMPLYRHSRELAQQCENHPNISVYLDASATYWQPDRQVTAVQQVHSPEYHQRMLQIKAKSIVMAAGCREIPQVFEQNDRPGVMLPGCAHRLARTYGILPGKQAVFSIASDEGVEAALDLHELGIGIAAVADLRPEGCAPALAAQLAEREIPYLKGWRPVESKGKKEVEGVVLSSVENGGETRSFPCDLLATSAGLAPRTELITAADVSQGFDPATGVFLPEKLPAGIHLAGRMLGYLKIEAILHSGRQAGLKAAGDCGQKMDKESVPLPGDGSGFSPEQLMPDSPLPLSSGRRAYLCFDTDTTLTHLKQAVKMGIDSPDLFQRMTGAGGAHLPRLLSQITSLPVAQMRPAQSHLPVRPQLCAAWAGERPDTVKVTPLSPLLEKSAAVFHRKNGWRLAMRYASDPRVQSELNAVHEHAGIMDACGRGIFRLFGPDALEVLQRMYVSDFSKLIPGGALYSAVADENGSLVDHGVVACTGEGEYLVTTTPERAEDSRHWIHSHLPEHVRFFMSELTHALGVIRLAGPYARTVLQSLTESNVSDAAFPELAYRRMMLANQAPVQVIRATDLGAPTYDIYIAASWMQAMWELLLEKGKNVSIAPFGHEAQRILHLESGHIRMERETDRRTTLLDGPLGRLWDRDKPVQSLGHPALLKASGQTGRLKRVQFKVEEQQQAAHPLKDGAVVTEGEAVCGHVCLCRYSPKTGAVIGTALVRENLSAPGTRMSLFQHGMAVGERISAVVTESVCT